MTHSFEVTDDSGFLGLFDPDAYVSFVDENWTTERLFGHFRRQMLRETLLLWGTGRERLWRVQVEERWDDPAGFRAVTGPIVASAGRLCLTNYDSLSMGAQFEDVALPEPHDARLLLAVPAGRYSCRVVQLTDPKVKQQELGPDFLVQLQRADIPTPPWEQIPWSRSEDSP